MHIGTCRSGTVTTGAVESHCTPGKRRGPLAYAAVRRMRVRMLEYSPGYQAEPLVHQGALPAVPRRRAGYRAGRRPPFQAEPGMRYQVADGAEPHRSARHGAENSTSSTDDTPDQATKSPPSTARLDIDAIPTYLTLGVLVARNSARHRRTHGADSCASGCTQRRPAPGRIHPRDHRLRDVRLPCDVYVLEEHRGRGLWELMMRTVMAHPG